MASANNENEYDFLVIGAGIAGISVASHLAEHASVAVLEQEDQAAYHTTGRSAAMFLEAYGPDEIRILTRASLVEYEGSLQQEASSALLTPKATYNIARSDQMALLRKMQQDPIYPEPPQMLDAKETEARIPLLKPGYATGSFKEPDAREIDVHALLQVYTSRLRRRGGQLVTSAKVVRITRDLHSVADGFVVRTPTDVYKAGIVVNAAGAWSDEVAVLAGIKPLGLVPKRRSIAVVAPPSTDAYHAMPFVADADETFYLKPDAGKFLISPADETPSKAIDVQPEEMDIAVVVDRVEQAFDFSIDRVIRSWAGLRSFFPDGVPVCGFDTRCNGFFWLAGQGGYGIQTAPALSGLAAGMLLEAEIDKSLAALGSNAERLAPERLMSN